MTRSLAPAERDLREALDREADGYARCLERVETALARTAGTDELNVDEIQRILDGLAELDGLESRMARVKRLWADAGQPADGFRPMTTRVAEMIQRLLVRLQELESKLTAQQAHLRPELDRAARMRRAEHGYGTQKTPNRGNLERTY